MDHFVDALGDICPIPIIKVEKILKQVKANERIVLETDHSCSIASVTNHFQKKFGYPTTITEVEEGVWQIIIIKRASTDPDL